MAELTERQAMARFRTVCELHETGVAMMLENLRRRHPSESQRQIHDRLGAWLEHRDDARDLAIDLAVRAPAPERGR